MKKYMIRVMIVCTFISTFFAFTNISYAASMDTIEEDLHIDSRKEQVKWYYRTKDGKQQKRLWSVTYGKWLTDWINC